MKCQEAPLRFIKGKESIEEGEVVAEKRNPTPPGGGFEKVDSKKARLLSQSLVSYRHAIFCRLQTTLSEDDDEAPSDEMSCCEGHFLLLCV